MLLAASLGVCNHAIGRIISPFKRRFDPMFAVVAVGQQQVASGFSSYQLSAGRLAKL